MTPSEIGVVRLFAKKLSSQISQSGCPSSLCRTLQRQKSILVPPNLKYYWPNGTLSKASSKRFNYCIVPDSQKRCAKGKERVEDGRGGRVRWVHPVSSFLDPPPHFRFARHDRILDPFSSLSLVSLFVHFPGLSLNQKLHQRFVDRRTMFFSPNFIKPAPAQWRTSWTDTATRGPWTLCCQEPSETDPCTHFIGHTISY